jgi:hypothetical protein
VFVWGFFGNLPTVVKVSGIADDGKIVCYLSEEEVAEISVGMTIKTEDLEGMVISISTFPTSYEETSMGYIDEYTLYALDLKEWNYAVTSEVSGVSDGITELSIVIDNVNPISFILN